MSKVYGLMSDMHAFGWSQFATIDATGVNTRLREILSEMVRCADEVQAAGGDTIVFAGDLFHTRGAIAPEVFNPTFFTIRSILERELKIIAIPGNHDLASKETTELGNAMQSLAGLEGFEVYTDSEFAAASGQHLLMVPWISSVDELKKRLESMVAPDGCVSNFDVVMHAGIDGVLSGVPAHNLPASYLAGLGFKRVFAGHYHHHCTFEDGKVVSIGATGHQTFSDIGTKAGFLLIYPDRIVHRASHCPQFVEVTSETDPDEISLIVDGNYARVRGMKLTDRQINETRKELLGMGAKGVSFQVERVTDAVRTGAVVTPTTTLEGSVAAYVASKSFTNPAAVQARCAAILAEVRSTAV